VENQSNVLVANRFDSFEALAGIAADWDVDFRQMDSSRFKSELFQTRIGEILISSARFGCHVEQHGVTPREMRTFAIPEADSPTMRWFGHQVQAGVLLVFPTHGEIEAFTRPGFGVSTFSVPEYTLAGFFEQNEVPEPSKILSSSESIIPVSPALLFRLRALLRHVSLIARNSAESVYFRRLKERFHWQLLSTLLEILRDRQQISDQSTRSGNTCLLKRLIDHVHTHADERLRVSDLCTIAKVSERTLQNLFKKELGMTPKAYLIGQKMYAVHRELWEADPAKTRVLDVANYWDFWHMGQFAADYRRIFGELPSETLNRSSQIIAAASPKKISRFPLSASDVTLM